ncbi:MAG TPA: DUF2339 domain-containing protein [Longimicrobiaceae bacterium]|nr:DUF2339 domain-containing protein [Longimicrobiaceae bacterium]
MAFSAEERLRFTESLLAALLRERAGVATEDDADLLQSATLRARRAVGDIPGTTGAPAAVHEREHPPRAYREREEIRERAAEPEVDWDAARAPAAAGPRRTPGPVPAQPSAVELWIAAKMKATPGDWIARAGMALLLLGVAFLCKYSIDRGWTPPIVRVGLGGAVGAGLLALGVRTHRNARPFSALFLGGAVGTWYISTYAAYALYHLASFPVAFGLMLATTLAAFALALWSGVEVLAMVGVLGGIGTPFVLSTGHASAPGFVGYLLFILALACAAYLARGWRLTFAVGVVGTWMALSAASTRLLHAAGPLLATNRTAMTVGYAAVLLAAWGVYLLARLLPGRFGVAAVEDRAHEWWARTAGSTAERVGVLEGYVVTAAAFGVAWASAVEVWDLDPRPAGYIGLGIAAVTALTYAALRDRIPGLARAHAFTAAFAGGCALAMVSRNEAEGAAAVVLYGLALHAWRARLPVGRPVRLVAHLCMALASLTAAIQAFGSGDEVNARMAMLITAACLYAVSARAVSAARLDHRDGYRLAGHGAATLLLWSLCEPLQSAVGWFVVVASAAAAGLWWLQREGDDRPLPGRPVDRVAAAAIQALCLLAVLDSSKAADASSIPWFGESAAAEVALIASLCVSAIPAGVGTWRNALASVAYLLWLFTAADQFSGLAGGAAFTTATWAATGLGLLLVALPRRNQPLVRVALGTIAVVCGKLLLVDLADLDAIWRILVFLGVGAAFLGVSYYVRTAWLVDDPESVGDAVLAER